MDGGMDGSAATSSRSGGGVNAQAILEAGWHFAVIAFATPWFARCLLKHRSAMLVALGVLIGGAVYHIAQYPTG